MTNSLSALCWHSKPHPSYTAFTTLRFTCKYLLSHVSWRDYLWLYTFLVWSELGHIHYLEGAYPVDASLLFPSLDLRDMLKIRSGLNWIWAACWVLAEANLPLLHFPPKSLLSVWLAACLSLQLDCMFSLVVLLKLFQGSRAAFQQHPPSVFFFVFCFYSWCLTEMQWIEDCLLIAPVYHREAKGELPCSLILDM